MNKPMLQTIMTKTIKYFNKIKLYFSQLIFNIFDYKNKHLLKLPKFLILITLSLVTFSLILFLNSSPALAQEGNGFNIQESLVQALEWIDSLGVVGAIIFIALYVIATVAFLPGSILTLGAGVIFNIFLGSILVFIGATIGATGAFLVGRYIARGWVSGKIEGNKKFKAIDTAVGKEGFKIVALTRLSPVFPFNLLNYAYGLTGVSLKDYVIGSVGMIPGTIMYVYIGSLAGSLATLGTESATEANPVAQWSIRIVGFIATVAVTLYVTKIAKKALDEAVDESNEAADESNNEENNI